MPVTSDLLERGTAVGGYRIDGLISRGGMGVVYRATNVALEHSYALKVLAPELAGDVTFQERFRREMRIAAALRHPNVVAIHYAGEQHGMLFFVMDIIDGTDLREILVSKGAMEPARAVELLRQIASALDCAHAHGLVHRDVKPGNILICESEGPEHAYLTDFGLAKQPDGASALTQTGFVVGTVDYIAPEQVTGGHVDARADIYALGCVFFQMLTGGVPYKRATSVATLFAHVNDPPPPLSGPVRDSHPELAPVIATAMAKNPNERFYSAGDFARDAEAALSGGRYAGAPTIVATGDATVIPGATMLHAVTGGDPTEVPGANATDPPEHASSPTADAPTDQDTAPAALAPTEQGFAATALTPTKLSGAPGATPPTGTLPPTTLGGATPPAGVAPPSPPPAGPPGASPPKPPWYQGGVALAAFGIVALVIIGVAVALAVSNNGSSTTTTQTASVTSTSTSTTTATQSSTSTTTSATSTPTATPATDPSPQGALTAVNNYWQDIANSDFAGAWTRDAPGVAGESQSQFVANEQQANIQSIEFQGKLLSSSGSGGSATVGIELLKTVDQQNGCQTWTGQYQLAYTNGNWLISSANLTPHPC